VDDFGGIVGSRGDAGPLGAVHRVGVAVAGPVGGNQGDLALGRGGGVRVEIAGAGRGMEEDHRAPRAFSQVVDGHASAGFEGDEVGVCHLGLRK
jgi:hypothetical protein